MRNTKSNAWFSIIETMIWIFIFSAGLISTFLIISSSLDLNRNSKNDIIASNLAREDIEIIKNIRENNYNDFQNWGYTWDDFDGDSILDNIFEEGVYKIQNDFLNPLENTKNPESNLEIVKVTSIPEITTNNIKNLSLEDFRVYLDDKVYTYDKYDSASNSNKKTIFYKFLEVKPAKYYDTIIWTEKEILKSVEVTSKVFWYDKWLKNVEIKTVLTNWKY